MNKIAVAFLAILLCLSASCVNVGMNDETKARVDKALADVERIGQILEQYHADVKALIDRLNRVIDRFVPAPPPEKPAEKPAEKAPEKKANTSP